ncbi:hypothetical protein E05_49280 [Plautia stali symbiont]|nr:hypothetical protein E05_49280 [Plautia stali symbiont]
MQLNDHQIQDINTIAAWLALDQLPKDGTLEVDLAILAGHAVLPNVEAVIALAKKYQLPLLISGGIGHSTSAAGRDDCQPSALSPDRHRRQGRSAAAGRDGARVR